MISSQLAHRIREKISKRKPVTRKELSQLEEYAQATKRKDGKGRKLQTLPDPIIEGETPTNPPNKEISPEVTHAPPEEKPRSQEEIPFMELPPIDLGGTPPPVTPTQTPQGQAPGTAPPAQASVAGAGASNSAPAVMTPERMAAIQGYAAMYSLGMSELNRRIKLKGGAEVPEELIKAGAFAFGLIVDHHMPKTADPMTAHYFAAGLPVGTGAYQLWSRREKKEEIDEVVSPRPLVAVTDSPSHVPVVKAPPPASKEPPRGKFSREDVGFSSRD